MALLPAAALATPASATSGPHGPRYSLTILEGATTLPEYEQASETSASVSTSAPIAVSIIRGGTTLYRDQGEGSAGLSQVPAVGDEVTVETPLKTVVARTVYDGLPTMDPTVCAGSTNFSGQNTTGNIVEGKYFNRVLVHPYHHSIEVHQTAFGEAQVKTLSGTAYGGSFLTPLVLGEDVVAIESLKTPLAGEATYTYTSEVERPVGACPAPPPVFVPPPPPALQGTIAKLLHTTIHAFLKSGARDQVTINQPGTVTQDLFLAGGKLPAYAAGSKHHKLPPALLLARGSTTAAAAGKVTVHLKLTRKGRARFKSAGSVKAVLMTTLHSRSGAKINLARHTISLHR